MDGFPVGHAGKGLGQHALQAVDEALVHEVVEELEVALAAGQGMVHHMAGQAFAQLHDVFQFGKGHLGLDHPELGGVARGVGVLGAEGGAEGVDAAQAQGQGFGFQLAGHGQVGLTAEEVLGKILFTGGQGGHAEHLARALAVGTGEDGRMHPGKVLAVEVVMHGARRFGADAEGRAVLVGAHAQVGDAAQELVGVALLLQGEGFGIGQAEHADALGTHFPLLSLAGGGHQLAGDGHGSAGVGIAQTFVGGGARIHDALHVGQAGTVVDLHEAEVLGIAAGADPAADGDLALRGLGGQGIDDKGALHDDSLCRKKVECVWIRLLPYVRDRGAVL